MGDALQMKGKWLSALVVALVVAGCGASEPELSGFVRDPAPEVGGTSIPDVAHGGEPFRLVAPEGSILVVAFGYTSCPDVCPTTMAHVRSAAQSLGSMGERVEVAFVSVDPGRDTPEVLNAYMAHFSDRPHALRTDDPARLRAVALAFGADYTVTGSGVSTVVEHTADLYAVDDQGRVRVTWPFGTRWQSVARDLKTLLEQERT